MEASSSDAHTSEAPAPVGKAAEVATTAPEPGPAAAPVEQAPAAGSSSASAASSSQIPPKPTKSIKEGNKKPEEGEDPHEKAYLEELGYPPSMEEVSQLILASQALRAEGDKFYKNFQYDKAIDKYAEAAATVPAAAGLERALCYAHMAACFMGTKQYEEVIDTCTAALEDAPAYDKALRCRCEAYQQLKQWDKALEDAQKMVSINKDVQWAAKQVTICEKKIAEQQEQLKADMLLKLKDLGNTLLGKFGMSLNNFKAERDPETGGYSIRFQQNAPEDPK